MKRASAISIGLVATFAPFAPVACSGPAAPTYWVDSGNGTDDGGSSSGSGGGNSGGGSGSGASSSGSGGSSGSGSSTSSGGGNSSGGGSNGSSGASGSSSGSGGSSGGSGSSTSSGGGSSSGSGGSSGSSSGGTAMTCASTVKDKITTCTYGTTPTCSKGCGPDNIGTKSCPCDQATMVYRCASCAYPSPLPMCYQPPAPPAGPAACGSSVVLGAACTPACAPLCTMPSDAGKIDGCICSMKTSTWVCATQWW